jgi:hypothetical protein
MSSDSTTFADHSQTRPATVIWATGFRPDYSWIDIPEVTTGRGVEHERGISRVTGLTFIGLPWQHTRGSPLLGFVKDDAEWLAGWIAATAALQGAWPRQRAQPPNPAISPVRAGTPQRDGRGTHKRAPRPR